MSMKLKVLLNGEVSYLPLNESSYIYASQPGAVYTLVDEAGMPVTEELLVFRNGEALELVVNGETVAEIDGFYAAAEGEPVPEYWVEGSGVTAEGGEAVAMEGSVIYGGGEATEQGLVWSANTGMVGEATAFGPAVAVGGLGGAAGAGAGAAAVAGVAALDNNDSSSSDDTTDVTVTFDLIAGTSSTSHDEWAGEFQEDVSYTIYIVVDSDNGALYYNDQVWTGSNNLGSDDTIVLVGDGSDVIGGNGQAVSDAWIYWYGFASNGTTQVPVGVDYIWATDYDMHYSWWSYDAFRLESYGYVRRWCSTGTDNYDGTYIWTGGLRDTNVGIAYATSINATPVTLI